MPANLPPQYFEAEKTYREAKSSEEKIAALEDMLAIMPKHKGTDHLRAELRRRISKLAEAGGQKSATHHTSMTIPKEGAAQVAVVGLTNSGKSQLVASITNAAPAVADYPFTTRSATPGMMEFENIQIQLIDTPPLVSGSTEFWMTTMMVRADALLVMIDLGADPLSQMEDIIGELKRIRIAITKEEPTAEPAVPSRFRKALLVANKIDLPLARESLAVLEDLYRERLPVIAISAKDKIGLEELKVKLYQVLDIIRVYTRAPGGKPDLSDPIILNRGATLTDAAEQVHKDFRARLKYARVWGSGKHDGIMVKRDHVLEDGDVIELHV